MSDLKDAVIRCIKCANPDPCPDRENDMQPHETSLRQEQNNAMLQPRQHVDFVSQLPSDIVITTLIPMFMHDDHLDASSPCQYLYVSKIWRYLIIQCLDGLRFGINDHDEYNMHTISQLVQFAPYIKTLIMPMLSDRWMAHILYTSNLCSLREITIHGFENRNMKYFTPALKSITTLTHLNITSDHVSFADILLNCPNLISLTMVHHRIDFSSSSMPVFSKLTALHITHEPLPMTCHQVIDICRCLPSLKKLHLSICKDMQCVLVVPEYYPLMTHLNLSTNRSGIHMTYADQRQSYDDQQGITNLVIRGDNRPYVHCEDIMTLLEQHRTTLAHLEWDIRIDSIDIELYNIQFPYLTSLFVNWSGWWIPRNAPLLYNMNIIATVTNYEPTLLDMIPPKLESLAINGYSGIALYQIPAIERYLNRFSQQGKMKEFVLHIQGIGDTEPLFDAICHLNQLERLMIHHQSWDFHHLERFLCRISDGCPYLTCIKINSKAAPSPYAMTALKRLENLEHLAFSITGTNDNATFWDSIESFQQLKRIQIYPAKAVNLFITRRLKERRPDMEIVVHTSYIPF